MASRPDDRGSGSGRSWAFRHPRGQKTPFTLLSERMEKIEPLFRGGLVLGQTRQLPGRRHKDKIQGMGNCQNATGVDGPGSPQPPSFKQVMLADSSIFTLQ
jgi:hypothetical protein